LGNFAENLRSNFLTIPFPFFAYFYSLMNNMKGKGIIFLAALLILLASCSQKIIPDKPTLAQTNFNLDSVPVSEINIPIQISLKPVYAMAEKNVDTLFTSANYPDGWVQEGCDMRYKYSFRRSPLQMKASGTSMNLAFTGYYKIIGSSRVCVMGAAVSPWTPPCRCGFSEPERRVNVSFNNSMAFQPDYKVNLTIRRNEPQPLDKCEVCFWGQDITKQVMKGLTEELDAAKMAMDKNFGTVDLKPKFQQVWDQLNKAYNVYGMGWLQINPQKIRINNLFARNDSLYVYLGMAAKPVISFEKPADQSTRVPNITDFSQRQGFSVFLDAVLNYDSLSTILSRKVANKEFDFNKGPVKKKFIIQDCALYGEGNEKLIIKINFSGTDKGSFYLTGKPVYDKATHILQISDIDFDVKSKNTLLKSAEWLFNKRIINEISKFARYDLTSFIDTAKAGINQQLNHEWVKGIRSYGTIEDVKLVGIYPLSRFLVIRSNCSGQLFVKVESLDFSL
jgi:Domain of unknown function (DUF4403)